LALPTGVKLARGAAFFGWLVAFSLLDGGDRADRGGADIHHLLYAA
jgi:hypothetical protein